MFVKKTDIDYQERTGDRTDRTHQRTVYRTDRTGDRTAYRTARISTRSVQIGQFGRFS